MTPVRRHEHVELARMKTSMAAAPDSAQHPVYAIAV
jgi:hypothetical protein